MYIVGTQWCLVQRGFYLAGKFICFLTSRSPHGPRGPESPRPECLWHSPACACEHVRILVILCRAGYICHFSPCETLPSTRFILRTVWEETTSQATLWKSSRLSTSWKIKSLLPSDCSDPWSPGGAVDPEAHPVPAAGSVHGGSLTCILPNMVMVLVSCWEVCCVRLWLLLIFDTLGACWPLRPRVTVPEVTGLSKPFTFPQIKSNQSYQRASSFPSVLEVHRKGVACLPPPHSGAAQVGWKPLGAWICAATSCSKLRASAGRNHTPSSTHPHWAFL